MEIICKKEFCTGCGACSGICPKDCISFLTLTDQNCHIYPIINQEKCINCGLCAKICPANWRQPLVKPSQTFAAYNKNDEECMRSTSGGVAFLLSKEILRIGGVVYGAMINYGNKFSISHQRIDTIEKLGLTQGSKYVQSYISRDIYQSIKDDILSMKNVLFIGTGCQVAGVKNFLRRDYKNFYCIDIICHGVPPLAFLKEYLSRKVNVSDVKKLMFRKKSFPQTYGIFAFEKKQIDIPLKKNLFMMGFMKGLYLREACYNCLYAQPNRGGDISLGDFWGLKKQINPNKRISEGNSLVLINNSKGKDLFIKLSNKIFKTERALGEAIQGNPQLNRPSSRHFAYIIFKKINPYVGFRVAATVCLIREIIFYKFILPVLSKIKK